MLVFVLFLESPLWSPAGEQLAHKTMSSVFADTTVPMTGVELVRYRIAIVISVLVILCALGVVAAQHKARKLFVELQQAKDQAQQMEVEWGQLQLEQSTWAMSARVEKIASQKLYMQLPQRGQIQFIRGQPLREVQP